MEHDLLATPDQLLPADGDADLIQVEEGSLLLRSPISRHNCDDSYPLPDPRAGYLLSFHVCLPYRSTAPAGYQKGGEMCCEELALRSLRQVAHDGAQAEVSGQVRGEAPDTEGLAGIELYLASGEVREDGACGVDRILTLQADEALAHPETLLAGDVEARLSSPRAADGHPVPVEDERLAGAQHTPRRRR